MQFAVKARAEHFKKVLQYLAIPHKVSYTLLLLFFSPVKALVKHCFSILSQAL